MTGSALRGHTVGFAFQLVQGAQIRLRRRHHDVGVRTHPVDHPAAVLQAIRDTPNDGTGVDTFVELQNLVSSSVNTFKAALQIIQNYAQAHTDPTQLGTDQPTAQTYLDLGITNVSQTNVRSMNSALAVLAGLIIGYVAWTLTEYFGHRYLFLHAVQPVECMWVAHVAGRVQVAHGADAALVVVAVPAFFSPCVGLVGD
ncbi:MAG: hypothetical protein RJA29_1524, partial [Pseudomonadota bacterium]